MNSTYCIFTWLGKHDAMNNIVNLCKPCDMPTMHANSIVQHVSCIHMWGL